MGLFSRKGGWFTGPPRLRQVNEQSAAAFEAALGRLGPVTHAADPQRSIAFASGGTSVWSVAFVGVPGPRPYILVVTYGLSYPISPEGDRADIGYELSIAIPQTEPVSPWAETFLRGHATYILTQKTELKVGECVPFRGVPITRVAVPPEQAATMPDSTLVGVLVAQDPVIPTVRTPTGDVEVRRIVGVDQAEIDRIVTWNPLAFLDLVRGQDPLLLSPLRRQSYLSTLSAAIDSSAQREGSTVESVTLDFAWQQLTQAVRITLPQGPAAERALTALRGRIGFGRKLIAFSAMSPPLTFTPGPAGIDCTPQGLELLGDLATPPISVVVDALANGTPSVELPLVAPPAARVRSRFFDRIAWVIRSNELDAVRMTKELGKLIEEARTIAAMEAQVPPTERDADRAAATAVVRTLRFARTTDQSTVEPLIQLLSPKY